MTNGLYVFLLPVIPVKTGFLYTAPHIVHKTWAESLDALFIEDKVKKLSIPNLSRLFKSLGIIKKIPKDIDILLCESSSNTFSGALWKLQNPGKKAILIASDPKWHFLSSMGRLKKQAHEWALGKFDLIIATSPMMKEKFPSYLQSKIKVVFAFADTERFLKKKADLDAKNIIYTGRVSKDKGADLVLEAFKLVKQKELSAKMYFVGISSKLPNEGDLREQLEKQNVKDVIFTGMVKNPEEYMKNCSILMSLARIDAANISVIEAMCMGMIPIVSTGVGYQHIVKELGKELVVQNEQEAAELVLKLWKNKAKMKEYSKKAVKIAAYYNKENSLKEFKEAVQSFL